MRDWFLPCLMIGRYFYLVMLLLRKTVLEQSILLIKSYVWVENIDQNENKNQDETSVINASAWILFVNVEFKEYLSQFESVSVTTKYFRSSNRPSWYRWLKGHQNRWIGKSNDFVATYVLLIYMYIALSFLSDLMKNKYWRNDFCNFFLHFVCSCERYQ